MHFSHSNNVILKFAVQKDRTFFVLVANSEIGIFPVNIKIAL